MAHAEKGEITFWVRHTDRGWTTNDRAYEFGPFGTKELEVRVRKHPDRSIELTVSGLFGQTLTSRSPIPEWERNGLFVAITWAKKEVNVYLNRERVSTLRAS